jgi:hypothetical protein
VIPFSIFPSVAQSATLNGQKIENLGHHRGIKLYLDITAVTGTNPTLDVKLQSFDKLSEKWFDIPGAAFAQKTTTGQSTLTLYPGSPETANESLSDVLPDTWRTVVTIGGTTPSFTFSLGGCLLP